MAREIKAYAGSLWWLFVVVSVILVVFGLVTLFYPGLTLTGLVSVFAVFVVIYGLVELFEGFSAAGRRDNWWLSLLVGVLLLGLGVFLAKHPDVSVTTFALLVGWTLLPRGVVDALIGLFYSPTSQQLHWYITGALGIVAGVLTWSYPADSALVFTWVLGLWALVVGAITLARALSIRTLAE